MNRSVTGSLRLVAFTVLLLGVWCEAGAAQPQPAPQKPASPAPAMAQGGFGPAPVVAFQADGVTLEEAVQMTLSYNPNIRLADAASKRQEGVAQQQTGLFDPTLLLNVSFEHRIQELTETRKTDQRKKRTDLQDFVAQGKAAADQTQRLVTLLDEAQKLPPGSAQVKSISQLSPGLGSQIQALDALIANSPAGARDALLSARQQLITDSLAGLRGGVTQYQQLVADAELSLARLGAAPDDEFFSSGNMSLKLSKYFRSGLGLTPFFDGSVASTSFVDKPLSSDFGGKGVEDTWTFKAGLNLVMPLWRGRGSSVFGAGEKSALVERDASRLAYDHQVSAAALATIRAYWDLRAAHESLEATARSVEIATRIVEVTRNLITAEELPATELARAQASDSRARARLDDARRRERDARLALVRAIGTAPSEVEDSLPRAKDAFPPIAGVSALAPAATEALTKDALKQRKDLSAARQLEQAGRIREVGAKGSLGPRFDAKAGTWLTALGERNVSRVIDRWTGPSMNFGVEFEKPFGNNQLEGQYAQRGADHRQRQISADDLARRVTLDVLRVSQTIGETADRVQQAEAAAGFYRATVDAEIERFRAGEATLIDTLTTEQQLTDARLTLASARRDLWQLVAELRYQTATLITGATVAGPQLITMPPAAGR